MHTPNIDVAVFGFYLVAVALVGYFASRKEKGSDDYFLAGRNLAWWVIGGSLIAANISTHHFIGMGGQGFSKGLAIASYEWLAAIALILYAKFFLPYYLKSRITTMPEFLQTHFDDKVRLLRQNREFRICFDTQHAGPGGVDRVDRAAKRRVHQVPQHGAADAVGLFRGAHHGDRLGQEDRIQGMTAHYLTHSTYPLKSGDVCLVHAAAGGTGTAIGLAEDLQKGIIDRFRSLPIPLRRTYTAQ